MAQFRKLVKAFDSAREQSGDQGIKRPPTTRFFLSATFTDVGGDDPPFGLSPSERFL